MLFRAILPLFFWLAILSSHEAPQDITAVPFQASNKSKGVK